MSRQPLVIFSQNKTRSGLLREIIDTVYPGPIHQFSQFTEIPPFVENERPWLIYMELKPGDQQYIDWVRGVEDDVIGLISWEWEQQQVHQYVEAGIYDYIFMPPQPAQIVEQIEHLLESEQQT